MFMSVVLTVRCIKELREELGLEKEFQEMVVLLDQQGAHLPQTDR